MSNRMFAAFVRRVNSTFRRHTINHLRACALCLPCCGDEIVPVDWRAHKRIEFTGSEQFAKIDAPYSTYTSTV